MRNRSSLLRSCGGALLGLSVLLVLGACQNPIARFAGRGGSLSITVADGVSRTFLPGISMSPTGYRIEGAGPDGAAFERSLNGTSSISVTELAFGDWNIEVTATNADGTPIGVGSAAAVVHTNETTAVNVLVVPYSGFGTLSLQITWPAVDIEAAQVSATLLPGVGSSRTLQFIVDREAGTASFAANDVASGYHTLTVKLLDNGALAMGAVEVVRIADGQATSGTLSFANVNRPGGAIAIDITPQMDEPLTVSITGEAATKALDQTLGLTASIAETEISATYVWYVNGEARGTGSGFLFDDSWVEGVYRIDVTAFGADGKRAGSATTNLEVVSGPAALPDGPNDSPLTLWDDGTNHKIPSDCFASVYGSSVVLAGAYGRYVASWNDDGWKAWDGSGPGTSPLYADELFRTISPSRLTSMTEYSGVLYFLGMDSRSNVALTSFDGHRWRYDDGSGEGSGAYGRNDDFSATTHTQITNSLPQLAVYRDTLVVVTADLEISSYDGSAWRYADGSGDGTGVHHPKPGATALLSTYEAAPFGDALYVGTVTQTGAVEWVTGVSSFDGTEWKLADGSGSGSASFLQIERGNGYGVPAVALGVFDSTLVVSNTSYGIASYDGAGWRMPDGSGSGSGVYHDNTLGQTVDFLQAGNQLLLLSAYGYISSWDGSAWRRYDGEGSGTGLYSDGSDSVGFSNHYRSALFRGYLVHSAYRNVAVYDFARRAWLNTPMSGGGS